MRRIHVMAYSSNITQKLLDKITPIDQFKTDTSMKLAHKLYELTTKKWPGSSQKFKTKEELAYMLSETKNYTLDELSEIAFSLDLEVKDLF